MFLHKNINVLNSVYVVQNILSGDWALGTLVKLKFLFAACRLPNEKMYKINSVEISSLLCNYVNLMFTSSDTGGWIIFLVVSHYFSPIEFLCRTLGVHLKSCGFVMPV